MQHYSSKQNLPQNEVHSAKKNQKSGLFGLFATFERLKFLGLDREYDVYNSALQVPSPGKEDCITFYAKCQVLSNFNLSNSSYWLEVLKKVSKSVLRLRFLSLRKQIRTKREPNNSSAAIRTVKVNMLSSNFDDEHSLSFSHRNERIYPISNKL